MQGLGALLNAGTFPPGASSTQARIVIDGKRGAIFVYGNGGPLGALIGSWAGQAGTDPYGNAYPAGLDVNTGSFVGIGLLLYNPSPGANNLIVSAQATSGTDSYGNQYLEGIGVYTSGFALQLLAGAAVFYTGSLATGWTFQGQLLITGSGAFIVSFAASTIDGTLEVLGNVTLDNNLTVSGTLSVGGSSNTGVPVPNATSTVGLPDGTIHGTSGGASAGTAHTHGPGSFAVGNGQHSHDTQNHLHAL